MTRPGIEGGPNVTKRRAVTVAPTEGGALGRPAVVSRCNECNEALDMARDALAKARRLALVVQNALLNADLQRACSVLRDLQIAMSVGEFSLEESNGVDNRLQRVHPTRPLRE